MTDQNRFRGQDPDNEYGQDEYPTQDETSSSMGAYDDWPTQRDQDGRSPASDYAPEPGGTHGQDDLMSDMGDGMRSRRPGEGRRSSQQEDEFGDEETGGNR
ncbi:hypothetical protein [Actinomadura monticuli]|uniref:DUF5709 domain-containing protein n=1 Tax=Actinomadura monticuli TaxID=3097367 RepID=A0ABV4QBB3_9ACTN